MTVFYILVGLTLAGSVAAFFAGRLPVSSSVAFGLALIPIAGIGLMRVFC
jgi:hypothetical protein